MGRKGTDRVVVPGFTPISAPPSLASPPGPLEKYSRSDPRASCLARLVLPSREEVGQGPWALRPPTLTVSAALWSEGASSPAGPRVVAPRSESGALGALRPAGAAGSSGAGGGALREWAGWAAAC